MISVDTILSDSHDLSKLEELCRLCGRYQASNTRIFDHSHRYNYFKLINIHFKDELQISETDVLPLKLCVKCLKALMTWHEFYHDCLKVDKKFQKLVDKFHLNDPEKKSSSLGNEVEVIEVSVDSDNYDFFNENEETENFDISNVNIKESTIFPSASEFSPLDNIDDSNDSFSGTEKKTTDKPNENSESITTKKEEPKNTNNKNQFLALGKRSTASKASNDDGSFATKRAKFDSATKTKTGGDGGGVDSGKHLKQSSPSIKSRKSGKCKTAAKQTSSVAQKLANNNKDTKPSKVSAPKSEATTAKPHTPPVITLDDDDDDEEDPLAISQTEWERAMKEEDNENDKVLHSKSETDEKSQSKDELNGEANASATDDSSEKDKKTARPRKMCDVCGKVVSAKVFKEHMIMHNDPESMTCSCCGKLFSTVSTLKKHFLWTHTSLRPFMCDLCGNTFKRNDHLKLHRDHFHANENTGGTAVKCGVCGASVQTMVSLQSHMKRVHGENKVGPYGKDLNHKILADKSYECGICSLNFKQFSYLRIHIKFVHEKGLPWHINQGANGPYKCEPCKSTYATLQSLREHNRRRHDGAPVEKFHKECSHCGMLYKNRLHYSKHLAKISGRPTCYVCWNDFDNSEDLKTHINSEHLDELPFGCELCGVRFVYLTELRNHMYTHSKTKQFQCDRCSQSFVRKDFLKSHKRRHDGIRTHTCDECSKSFVEFCDLRKHMQIHLKNKTFPAVSVKDEEDKHIQVSSN